MVYKLKSSFPLKLQLEIDGWLVDVHATTYVQFFIRIYKQINNNYRKNSYRKIAINIEFLEASVELSRKQVNHKKEENRSPDHRSYQGVCSTIPF